MKQFLILALVFMSTPNERVVYLDRGFTNYNYSDVLVFTYVNSDTETESQIEVSESSGYSEPERHPAIETENDRPEVYTISPEMEQVLDYWNNFRN